jgi:hypothetical protein
MRFWRELPNIVLQLALSLAALGLSTFFALQSPPGRAWLASTAARLASAEIAGTLRIGSLEGDLITRIRLLDCLLLDEHGEQVATLKALELRYRLAPLLDRLLVVTLVQFEAPDLLADSSLAAALAPASADASEPSSPLPKLSIRLHRVQVRRGSLRLPNQRAREAASFDLDAAGRIEFPDADVRTALFAHIRNVHIPDTLIPPSWPSIDGVGELDLAFAYRGDAVTASARMKAGSQQAAVTLNGTVFELHPRLSATLSTTAVHLSRPLLPVPLSVSLQAGLHLDGFDEVTALLRVPRLAVAGLSLDGTTARATRRGEQLVADVTVALRRGGATGLHADYSLESKRLRTVVMATGLRTIDFADGLLLPPGISGTIRRLAVAASADLGSPGPPWALSATVDAADVALPDATLETAHLHALAQGFGPDVTGTALLSSTAVVTTAVALERVQIGFIRDASGPVRSGIRAATGDGFLAMALGANWDGTPRLPDRARILGLQARYLGLEVASLSAAEVTLGDLSEIALTPWQLGVADGTISVAGRAVPAANHVTANVRWSDLQLAQLTQFFGLPTITSVAAGEVALGGTNLASPTITGSLELHGLEEETTDLVRDLSATFSYVDGLATIGLDASPIPSGLVSLAGTLSAELSLRPYSFSFRDSPDASLRIEALPLATLSRFLPPEFPVTGLLAATGHMTGTFDAPEWDVAGTISELNVPVVRPLHAAFHGRLDATATRLTVAATWLPMSSVQVTLKAPAFRLLPTPEDLPDWLRRLPGETDLVSISSPHLELSDVLREAPPLRGALSGLAKVQGPLEAPRLAIELHAKRPVVSGLGLARRVDVTANYDGGLLTAQGQAALAAGGEVRINGHLPVSLSLLPFVFAAEPDRAFAEVWFAGAQLAAAAALVPEQWRPVGTLDGFLSIALPLSSPHVEAALRARNVILPHAKPLDLFLTATVEDGMVAAAASVGRAGQDLVRLQTRTPAWKLDGSGDTPESWLARWDHHRHSLRAQVDSLHLAEFLPELPATATLSLAASMLETPGNISLDANLTGFKWLDQELGLRLSVHSNFEQARVDAHLLLDEDSVSSASGTLGAPNAGSWLDAPFAAPIDFTADLSQAAGIFLSEVGAEYDIAFEIPPTLTATAQGSLGSLSATLHASANRASIRGLNVEQLTADARLDTAGAHLTLSVLSEEAGTVQASAALASPCLAGLLAENCPLDRSALSGHLLLAGVSDKPLREFLPRGYEVRFNAHGEVALGGTVSSPTLDGTIAADIARLRIPVLGWDLGDIALRLHSDSYVAILDPVVLPLGDGSATLGGRLDLASKTLNATLKLDKMPVSNRAGLRVIADGEAGVRGSLDRPEIYGDITVLEARIRDFPLSSDELHPLQLSSDVFFASDLEPRGSLAQFFLGDSENGRQTTFGDQVKGRIDLHIPGRFFYSGQGADLELEGDLAIGLAGFTPKLSGEVRTRRGKVNIFGRLFELRKALVQFTGSEEIDPVLDVEAVHPLRGVDLSGYGLQSFSDSHILVTVGGRVSDPEMSVTSNPVMSEDQIMTVLVMGRSRGGSEEVGGDATGLLAGILAQPLQARLVQKLPVDTLTANWREGPRRCPGKRRQVPCLVALPAIRLPVRGRAR